MGKMKNSTFFSKFGKVVCVVLFLAVIVLFIVPLVCITFKFDVVSDEYMEVTSVLLAVPSLLLAVYSVWTAWTGTKTTDRMVNKLDKLISGQEAIKGALKNSPAKTGESRKDYAWERDPYHS